MFKIEVVIADTQPVFVRGLKTLLENMENITIKVREVFDDGKDLIAYLQEQSTDLLILDLNLKRRDGFEAIQWIGRHKPDTRLLVLTAYDDERMVKKARRLGVNAYVFKTDQPDIVATAIKKILSGQSFYSRPQANPGRMEDIAGETGAAFGDGFQKKFSLTKRERQILEMIADAMSSKQIAKTLYISDQTVSVHRKNIMRKLGVCNTAGVIKVAYRYGWK
jgi:DNA-binding NarL/FixJ family response regulator